ncbi:nickel pincer cofactor biosynthesis protein LarC [Halomicronema sp. CCY15110]|uniref:nickel pincer cofactor biosynthesis protein LarC n=1 Tax=Halomicronema sp. CCY15110 TaxID=2767773 RepID=UPI0019518A79|nr:nickel pincer cofactor biosynthesis protein LarC [Halomicronema sp. CCY15110]
MKTLAFVDCPTGISGDMCLGALVSAGVPLDYLQTHIDQLQLPETVQLRAMSVRKNGIAATKVDVRLPHEGHADVPHPPVRHLHDIVQIIAQAPLPERAIAWSLAIFRRLAQAEGAIHGIDPQQVHFHEVGATDAIVDIVGTCLGFDWLGIDELHCAPLPTGTGTVRAAHGRLPVPAPAVLKLMEMAQVPIYNAGLTGELVTPTGAAIATELATRFGEPPTMQLQKIGLGAGNKELPIPNILRLWIGQVDQLSAKASAQANTTQIAPTHHPAPQNHAPHEHPPHEHPPHHHVPDEHMPHESHHSHTTTEREAQAGRETVTVLETQVDDLSPQVIGYLYDRLFAAGALDVFVQPVMMKKSRPGHLLVVIADPPQAATCEMVLLTETTTLGVRRTDQTRLRLRRELVPLQLPWGTVRMKVAFLPNSDRPLKAHPEYEDCAAIAQQHHRPWREIHDQALVQWSQQQGCQ